MSGNRCFLDQYHTDGINKEAKSLQSTKPTVELVVRTGHEKCVANVQINMPNKTKIAYMNILSIKMYFSIKNHRNLS